MAWFPLLFYSSLYIGDLHKRSVPAATTDEQQTIIDAEAIRLGSRALFYSALLAFTINLVLPAFVTEAAGHPSQNQTSSWWKQVCRVPRGMQVHLVTVWAASHLVFAGCMFATLYVILLIQISCIVYWSSSFTASLTAYGEPLSSSPLRDFHGLSLNGLRFPWFVVVTIGSLSPLIIYFSLQKPS